MSEFHINEKETYFPVEFYGDFSDTDIIPDEHFFCKYPLVEQEIIREIPNFGPNPHQPFLSDIRKEEREDACLGGTQADTFGTKLSDETTKDMKADEALEFRSLFVAQPDSLMQHKADSVISNLTNKADSKLGNSENNQEQLNDQDATAKRISELGASTMGKPSKIKSRWGKKQDKFLAQTLYDMEKAGMINIEEISGLDPDFEAPYNAQIQSISVEIKWKGLLKSLCARIQSVLAPKGFSVRDRKFLRKTLRQEYRDKPIDYASLLYHFPGRTVSQVKVLCNEIMEKSKTKFVLHTETQK